MTDQIWLPIRRSLFVFWFDLWVLEGDGESERKGCGNSEALVMVVLRK